MKRLAVILLLLCGIASNAQAQDLKSATDLAGIKTDPVLKTVRELAGVNTDPVLKTVTDLAGVNTDPVLNNISSRNFNPVLEMLDLLKARGVKTQYRIELINGSEWALITVNGKQLSPYLLSCTNCIEVEY